MQKVEAILQKNTLTVLLSLSVPLLLPLDFICNDAQVEKEASPLILGRGKKIICLSLSRQFIITSEPQTTFLATMKGVSTLVALWQPSYNSGR